ncbi:MAG TPA: hypothetical protein VNI01_04830 [Elusimicrobiota bacterium]|jgi:hypothetical protein|nr:hypothetical protein [Elusimicrobiota bacterium]
MEEQFDPGHASAPDSALAAPPAGGTMTARALFVCTYVARLGNLHAGVPEMTARLGRELKGPVLAVNSNFGHHAQPGWAGLLKGPPPPARRGPQRTRQRRVQGDGSCFNSAIELTLRVPSPGVRADKVYRVKCFPSTGETQIPGVIRPDLADGRAVLQALVGHLNALGAGDRGPEGPRAVEVLREEPKMLNYKFRLVRRSPRVLVRLRALAGLLAALERARALAGAAPPPALLAEWPAAVLPPFLIRETKPPTDDVKVSFRFSTPSGRAPRANVFQTGKINILGADSEESAEAIHVFFSQTFAANWPRLVALRPQRDADRAPAPTSALEPPAEAPAARIAPEGPAGAPAGPETLEAPAAPEGRAPDILVGAETPGAPAAGQGVGAGPEPGPAGEAAAEAAADDVLALFGP